MSLSAHTRQVAVVTGGGRGIGRACALGLADAGWNVVVAGRTKADLVEACALGPNDHMRPVVADVSDDADVDRLFDEAQAWTGRIDLLFNNAGFFPTGATIDDVTPDNWRQAVDVNLTGAFLCARRAFAAMRAQSPQGGRIINNGSVSAHVPRPHSVAYTATKHAMTGLTRSIALDGRPFDIACGQIDIGNVSSDMTAQMETGIRQADGSMRVEPTMDMTNVTASFVHMASLPLNANVLSMTVMATAMPYVGRG